jgi:hypothetical protein
MSYKKVMAGSLSLVAAVTAFAVIGVSPSFAAPTTTGSQEVHVEVLEECTFETGTATDVYITGLGGSIKTGSQTATAAVVTCNDAQGWELYAEIDSPSTGTNLTTDGTGTGTGFASATSGTNFWNGSWAGTYAVQTTATGFTIGTPILVSESTASVASDTTTSTYSATTDGSLGQGDYYNTVIYTLSTK